MYDPSDIKKNLKVYPYQPGSFGTSIAQALESTVRIAGEPKIPEMKFIEGPLWMPSGYLLFSDVQGNAIYRWNPGDKTAAVHLAKSGADECGAPGAFCEERSRADRARQVEAAALRLLRDRRRLASCRGAIEDADRHRYASRSL